MVYDPPGRYTVSGAGGICLDGGAPQLLINEQFDAVQTRDFAGGTVVFLTRKEPNKLTPNEDAIAILPVSPTAGVLAIADGCGGQANGQLASKLAMEALAESVCKCDNPSDLRAPILDGFETAIRRVRELGSGAATTLIAIEINEGILRTFHVGDSQALLVGSRGKIKLQTRAHSPVGYAVEAGMLSERAALQHADRHLVSNVIGSDDLHIDMGSAKKLDKQDTLVIGSDGLFDNLRLDEIVQLVRKGPLLQAAATIESRVAQRMSTESVMFPSKPDDLAMLVYRQGSPMNPRLG